MNELYKHTKSILIMGTLVHFTAISSHSEEDSKEKIKSAIHVFHEVERICSRFDADSELSRLTRTCGGAVPVSAVLFEALSFAKQMAILTNGAFDPTLGRLLAAHGFNRHYLTSQLAPRFERIDTSSTYKDMILNRKTQTILLRKPLSLDLGAVAKGFAVDLAIRHFQGMHGFSINAGGDVYVGGRNENNELWEVGIQHPGNKKNILCLLRLTDSGVCTSGSYERQSKTIPFAHHLLDPVNGQSVSDYISTTVIAPYTMAADAYSTAAFILGKPKGKAFLEKMGCGGILVDHDLTIEKTNQMEERYELQYFT
ncbi:FAD:protein FMN transferase [Fictibacillus enclensis]|uniref:FAD:protein FMN transferase n=1 Tax=Fictibacillus enclensis TaxID=1017270 RepID=UPI0024C084FF|nr:FAD:protein FMN transferase [Fictibacillus enclensis]WHY71526.1 FAD:protein FMN transferase [Fictibacillus enclensis]